MNSAAGLVLLDANVLIYAEQDKSLYHEASKLLRDRALTGAIAACVSPQVLNEFYAVVTNPRRVDDPLSAREAVDQIRKYYRAKHLVKIFPGPSIIKRELELLASTNFLLPRVDAVGRYRFRGLGNHLINSDRQDMRFDNAFQDLTTGDFQEWQLGIEVSMPVGFRKANAAVRNAQLVLARDHAILEEQENEVTHDLSAAFS